MDRRILRGEGFLVLGFHRDEGGTVLARLSGVVGTPPVARVWIAVFGRVVASPRAPAADRIAVAAQESWTFKANRE